MSQNTLDIVWGTLFNYAIGIPLFLIFLYVLARKTIADIGLYPAKWKKSWLGFLLGLTAIEFALGNAISWTLNYILYQNINGVSNSTSSMLSAQSLPPVEIILWFLFLGFVGPFIEELVFRGSILTFFRKFLPGWAAIVISSALFGLIHYNTIPMMISTFAIGIFYGYACLKTESVWTSIFMHSLSNIVSVAIIIFS